MDVKDLTVEHMEATLAFIKDEERKINKQYATEPYDGASAWDFLSGKDALESLRERAQKKLKKLKKDGQS
jgi:hypothetical protein